MLSSIVSRRYIPHILFATTLSVTSLYAISSYLNDSPLSLSSDVEKLFVPKFMAVEHYSGTDVKRYRTSNGITFYTDNKTFVIKGGEMLSGNASALLYSEGTPSTTTSQPMSFSELVRSKEAVAKETAPVVSKELTSLNELYKEKLKSYSAEVDSRVAPAKKQSSEVMPAREDKYSELAMAGLISSSSSKPKAASMTDKSCYIPFGGFDQPKIAYSEDCQKLSAEAKKMKIANMMKNFPDEFFIKHKAENETSQIYVFTDYTCGYCLRLHNKIDDFLKEGVSVNYIFYPRTVSDKRYEAQSKEVVSNMTYAWCSDDQVTAIDNLYKNKTLAPQVCKKDGTKLDSPVRQHYILGMMFEIAGTPLIVADNGATSYGFSRASTTLSALGIK